MVRDTITKTAEKSNPSREPLLRSAAALSDDRKSKTQGFTDVNRAKGLLTTNWSAVMLCGELIGATSLSLPQALQHAGFFLGLGIYIGMFIVSYYFAIYLSATFAEVRGKIKEILNLNHLRDPYPQLAKYVIGKKTGYLVAALIIFSDFLGSAVLLLLPSSMLVDSFGIMLAPNSSMDFNRRIFILLTALVVIPITWNDRLKDNTSVGLIALGSAIFGHFSLILLYLMSFWIAHEFRGDFVNKDIWNRGLVGIGIMMTTIDGFDVLPTLQEDMIDQTQYRSVLKKAYTILFLLTAPVMVLGYLIFSRFRISDNILVDIYKVIQSDSEVGTYESFHMFLAYMTVICFCIQITVSMVLQLNPTFQLLEKIIPCKEGFTLKRCVLRTTVIIIIMIFVEFAPALLPLMSTHGTILFVILGIVLPGIMFLRVFEMTHWAQKVLTFIIIMILAFFMFYNVFVSVKMIVKQVKDHTLS